MTTSNVLGDSSFYENGVSVYHTERLRLATYELLFDDRAQYCFCMSSNVPFVIVMPLKSIFWYEFIGCTSWILRCSDDELQGKIQKFRSHLSINSFINVLFCRIEENQFYNRNEFTFSISFHHAITSIPNICFSFSVVFVHSFYVQNCIIFILYVFRWICVSTETCIFQT